VYRLTVGIRERRFGRTVARAPLTVYVAGKRRASITVALDRTVAVSRQLLAARVVVINTGFTTWADAPVPAAEIGSRQTRLEMRWVDASDPTHVIEIDRLVPLTLASRKSAVVELELKAPGPGDWLLVAGAIDAIDGPFVSSGSREGVTALTVVPRERAVH
jgi:hypothetical protein